MKPIMSGIEDYTKALKLSGNIKFRMAKCDLI